MTENIEHLDGSAKPTVITDDRELNGEINRAATQGAKFALLLAMLDTNQLYRPNLHATEQPAPYTLDKLPFHYYRSSPLSATEQTWPRINRTSELVSLGDTQSAQLWLAMHPEPLSQFNDNTQLPVDVLANCSLPTQQRIKSCDDNKIAVDETGLYDILQSLTH